MAAKKKRTGFAAALATNVDRDCEKVSVSEHSPKPVDDREQLATCALNPDHYDNETGRPTHQLVKKAFGSGLSVSRLDFASGQEVTNLCEKIAKNRKPKSGQPQTISNGWLSAEAGKIRALKDNIGRLFWVFDTALDGDEGRAHADVVAMRYFIGPEQDLSKMEDAATQLLELFLEPDGVSGHCDLSGAEAAKE